MYSARISRNSPAAFIILIDQSGSMAETVVIDRKEVVKAKAVAFIVNMLIAELLNRSRREEGTAIISISPYWGITETRLLPCGRTRIECLCVPTI